MYGREKRVLLREYLDHGWSKSALAQKLGISRRTIYHWIDAGDVEAASGGLSAASRDTAPVADPGGVVAAAAQAKRVSSVARTQATVWGDGAAGWQSSPVV